MASLPASSSPDTALALVLPESLLSVVQPLRSLYDAGAIKWPPHINLFYPFVSPASLSAASAHLQDYLASICCSHTIRFASIEVFRGNKKRPSYLVLRPDEASEELLQDIYEKLSREFPEVRKAVTREQFKPHMTIGQIHAGGAPRLRRLVNKFDMLCPLLGDVEMGLAVMQRVDRKMTFVESWGVHEYPVALSPEAVPGSVVPRKAYTRRHPSNGQDDCWESVSCDDVERLPAASLTLSTFNVFVDIDDAEDQDGRWGRICDDILTLDATIVCLQEVADDLLAAIADSRVPAKYPYISHSPEQPLLRHRNCVVLSTVPFVWEELTSAVPSRSICVAKFPQFGHYTQEPQKPQEAPEIQEDQESQDDKEPQEPNKTWHPLIVCNVHLPAYLTDEAAKSRADYAADLKSHLAKYSENTVIIAGDTNIPDSAAISQAVSNNIITAASAESFDTLFPAADFTDAWAVAGEGPDGNTFNPAHNPIAAQNASSVQPHRYDRIYLRRTDDLLVREVRVGSSVASDHYPLTARLSFTKPTAAPMASPLSLPDTAITDDDVRRILLANNCFPSAEDTACRQDALAALTAVLTSDPPFPLRLIPVGSVGLGTYDAASDMDVLAVGAISASLFWRVTKHRIRKQPPSAHEIKIVRYVDATIPMLILLVAGVRIDLQYCTAPRLLESWDQIPTAPANSPLFALPVPTLKKLQAYRDMLYILNTVPNLAAFRLAYRYIKLWAVKKGMYSSKFGYLGGVHITLLLSRIALLLPPQASAAQLIVAFYDHYANWDWSENVLQPGRTSRYSRATRDKMVILAIHAPAVNVATNATVHTVRTLTEALGTAAARFALGGTLADVAGEFGDGEGSLTDGVSGFLTAYDRYVKVEVQFWGTNRQAGRGLIGWVESRVVGLLVEFGRQPVAARVWPGRFHEVPAADAVQPAQTTAETDGELRGFYLLGITTQQLPKDEKHAAKVSFATALQTFDTAVRAKGKFPTGDAWVSATCVKSGDLATDGRVALDDTMVWDGGEADGGDSIPDDSEDEEDDVLPGLLDENQSDGSDDFFSAGASKKKAAKKAAKDKGNAAKGSTPKLRPAHEVLHRIKWDPGYDSSSFVIGYEDRFRGVLEMPVDNWRTEASDEEFVPMHRVVYFREKGGEVVWDREKRVDRVFGSGRQEGAKGKK
ncbi:hypothetical protein Dda_6373 [Drechslerella dactyloides]|uniref:polynucleotide adenylyltransferase n=1 Tax=Drechslerella dactyloides TaxID=74499 RepID=A0AAD6ITE3_DREDA|nr:hypothetical protein Dda_6373 [Drechslerella dactyloides]